MKRTITTIALTVAAVLGGAGTTWAATYGNTLDGPRDYVHQNGPDCGEMADEVVIHEITGQYLSEKRIVSYAEKMNYYDGHFGTAMSDMVKILAHYGVKSTLGIHNLRTVEKALKRGDRVIAFVDAERIWNNNPEYTKRYIVDKDPNMGDHVVVVDQIDTTAGTVTLTDSGPVREVGANEVVSLHTFLSAWGPGTGDNWVIIAKHNRHHIVTKK